MGNVLTKERGNRYEPSDGADDERVQVSLYIIKNGDNSGGSLRGTRVQYGQVSIRGGYDVELIPPSKIKHLQMPDIILQGVPWKMKSPVEAGKYTIKNIVQNASHQSVNIIIDLRRCKMMDDEAIRKICHYFDLSKRIQTHKDHHKSSGNH